MLLLLQSTSLGMSDLLKLDDLIAHAKYHSETYGDSLLVFLSKHYGELKKEHLEHGHENPNDHEQLPFHHHSCSHHSGPIFVVDGFQVALDKFVSERSQTRQFYYKEPSSATYLEGIFQPPKHA